MTFRKSSDPVAATDFDTLEQQIGLQLPHPVRALYLRANGGVPKPHVFENDEVDTVVSEFLPLASAAWTYAQLVRNRRIVPLHFWPFAVDGGGDYFFVDCTALDGTVYFFRGDAAAGPRLINLHLPFEQFWAALKDE